MKFLMLILSMYTFLFAKVTPHEKFSEKMIVASYADSALADENFLKLKIYFIEEPAIRALEEQYHLTPKLETLGGHQLLVLSPIHSLSVRNQLLILLTPLFPDIFYINAPETIKDTQRYAKSDIQKIQKNPKLSTPKHKTKNWIDEIGLQWVAIWVLALIGLISSLLRRRKIAKLNKTQKDIRSDQKKIEKEITQLGVDNA